MFDKIKDWTTLVHDFDVKNNTSILNDIVVYEWNIARPNYVNKQIALKLNAPFQINKIRYKSYQNMLKNIYFDDELSDIQSTYYKDLKGYIIYRESLRLNNSYRQRLKRLKARITKILESNGLKLFLTFTFTDETLKNTSEETRRTYVARWLKDNCSVYVANIDYGGKNGREHYHAVVCAPHNIDYTSRTFGTINGKRVRLNESNVSVKLSKYVAKLSNHAIKDTTKRTHLIYSRVTH